MKDRQEAYSLLSEALERNRSLGFEVLCPRAGTTLSEDVFGPSGTRYSVDIGVAWSDSSKRELTIRGRIDDQDSFRFDPLEETIRVSPSAHQ